MIGALRYRSGDLVLAILATIYEQTDDGKDVPSQWTDIVEAFTSKTHDRKTVDGTLRDLVRYGALERTGHYTARADTRTVRPTTLGKLWIEREQMPAHPDDDE